MSEGVQATTKKAEPKRENKVSQTQKTGPSQSISSPVDQILFLQRTIGNQAVGKLIKSGALQAKLKIVQPRDIYEQEADRMAERVMRMPEPASVQQSPVKSRPEGSSIQSVGSDPEKDIGLTRLNVDKSASAYRKLVKMEYIMQKTSTDIENSVSNA